MNERNLFFQALENDDLEEVQALLEQGVDIHTESNGWVPLRYALKSATIEMLQVLLMHGARPFIEDQDDIPLLLDAIYQNKQEAVSLLLDYGLDPNRPSSVGHIPLSCATDCSPNAAIVKLLFDHGADPNSYDNVRKTFPFIEAARYLDIQTLKEFIQRGANPLVTDERGSTALMVAAVKRNKDIIHFLLELGIPVNAQNDFGDTALHWAAYDGNVEVIELLLKAGADATLVNKEERTPLMEVLANKELDPDVVVACAQMLGEKV
jgi:ankyrin repeat protein